ncbi:hypothetical protein P3X46_004904 [Hevea brasiliensis]|uniref:Uncharacterized protein n=1 Tax=Hevea brasiliensis TaxID=3981 RepID=A0ABQ9MZJ3_HEVBR|nr:uncharacterized protein LOC110647123 [Hevea brasiliensis]KAJ9185249.1 hypothetical protein P3X46_004904 [Hevea brasiliensis]
MSSHRETSDIFSLFVKATLLVSAVGSISLLFYSVFSNESQLISCLEYCDRVLLFDPRKFNKSNNISGDSYQETNISHILFGIGGNSKTWNQRRHYCELWWKPEITRGYVWLDEKPPETEPWPNTSPPYKVSEDTSRFKYSCRQCYRSSLRIARIVKESFELGLDNVRWFVMGDDDTVFFVENLVMVLAKYDHNQMYYIGGNSESVEQNVLHSYSMAYGGGGFAISYPLAKELVRVLDGCINRYSWFYGSDERIQACLSEIGIPLTKELGFHQVDIRGNPYGLLAAHPLAPLVSFHHLDYVKSIFPGMNQIDSLQKLNEPYRLDPGRTLQHSVCYDFNRNWSVSVSWGYTIQLYPSLVTAMQLAMALRTFQTWRTGNNEPFTLNTRPMSHDPCERPVVYFLDRAERVGRIQTLTTYKRHVDEGNASCGRSDYASVQAFLFVNVTSSILNPEIFKMAPRRQCCEIFNSDKEVVQVKIRGCNQFESVTPP